MCSNFMANNTHHHTHINIGPQDSESWFFVMAGLAAIAFFAFAVPKMVEAYSKEEVAKAQAHAK